MGQYPAWNCRQLDRRLREIGCKVVRTTGSHRHYSNPFHADRLITFAWHAGDVPRGIWLTVGCAGIDTDFSLASIIYAKENTQTKALSPAPLLPKETPPVPV